jgi:tetratricopeptide (TPR) repeat protein
MHGYFGIGIPYLARGDTARAIPPLERCVALCQATDIRLWLGEIAADLGLAYARAGRINDALPVLAFALKEAATTGLRYTYARQHAVIGEAYLLAGQPNEAARVATVALEAARAQKQFGQEAAALWLWGEIARCALDGQRAEADYQHAMGLALEIGLRPLVAHCHSGLGKLYRSAGNSEQAKEHLATATTMYREMDMTYWLAQEQDQNTTRRSAVGDSADLLSLDSLKVP